MRTSLRRFLAPGLLICGLGWSAAFAAAETPTPQTKADTGLGAALFVHNWARPEGWVRPETLGDGGDGLGPVFNEVSCVACHALAGVGGAGGNEHNVELLSVVIPPHTRPLRAAGLLKRARILHPQFTPGSRTVMLHRYGFGLQDGTVDYDIWREEVVRAAQDSPSRFMNVSLLSATAETLPLRLSQRNTPALWGAGELERLRRGLGDRLRHQISVEQRTREQEISGRIPRTIDGRSGWFGWRGHVEHLPEFVLSACSNELGLAVNNHPQPDSPRGSEEPSEERRSRSLDLTNSQVIALTRFVGSLPRPEQEFPTDPLKLEDVYAGERAFESSGCAVCHVPDLAFVKGVFSDLLLHDMGESLSDPVSAFPDLPPPPRARGQGSYSGGSTPSPGETTLVRTRLTNEWRTPPLWGVADSPPYLHDGRAETLDDAIRLHGGEARRSVDRYRELTDGERSSLIAFLGTLRAPQSVAAGEVGVP
jgi:CxxC motif-containing protein (DUF1111 family)